jgi:signal recognition particle subunit SRP54
MFERIKDLLRRVIKIGYWDEKLLEEFLRDLRRAMLQGDVHVELVSKICDSVRERVRKEKAFAKRELLVRIVYEELVRLLGERGHKIELKQRPFKILLVGLFGSGKTTTAAKLASFFKRRGNKVAMLCLDSFRPAAYDQLVQLGKKAGIQVFGDPSIKDPVQILKKFEPRFGKWDLIVVDSSGRDALDEQMREEIKGVKQALQPDETLLVMSADIGQSAGKQARAFEEALKISGVILTKTEGTAKGGGALSACFSTGSPVKFIGTGEKIGDFEEFDPRRYISRLIGLGDLETLLEKAKEVIKEEKAIEVGERIARGEFSLLDLYEQMQAMRKMGPLSKLIKLIPGMGMLPIQEEMLGMQESKLEKFGHIMQSMTLEELENPTLINSSRIARIARGAGVEEREVRELLNQHRKLRKVMKRLRGMREKDLMKLLRRFKAI